MAKKYEVRWIVVDKYDSVKSYNKIVTANSVNDAYRKIKSNIKLFCGDLIRNMSATEISDD